MTHFTGALLIIMVFFSSIAIPTQAFEKKREAVILLHGLARTKASMSRIENDLGKHGYMVVNMGYSSREQTIEHLSKTTIPKALSICKKRNAEVIHFVTHSMGGIMVRYYLAHHSVSNLGRVVMLSPPNHGSEAVDKLKQNFFFKWLNGPAGQQLGTSLQDLPSQLGPPAYEVGIITGDRSINLFLSWLIPGKDDGKVSIESAKILGMKDFMVVHKTHPFIMNDPNVHGQIRTFLSAGAFTK